MKVRKVSMLGLSLLLAVVVLLLPATGLAQGDGFYTVSQGETQVQITPLENPGGAGDFYGYAGSVAKTGFEEANTAVMFLYRDTVSGDLSLFVLLGGPNGTAGAASLTLNGVPTGADFLVRDDIFDFRDTWNLTPPTGDASWTWDDGFSDGMVLGPLGSEFSLTLFPQFTTGITQVKFLSGSINDSQEVSLNLNDPIIVAATLNRPPVASAVVSPTDPHINEPITFDASASNDPDGTIVSYEWDFDGDGIFDQTTSDPVVTYTYATSGMKTVTLRATDDAGATGRTVLNVDVGELAVSVTRTISTIAALPGTTFLVVVRIEPETDLAGAGLQENLPVGWKIKPLENSGAVSYTHLTLPTICSV